MYISRPLPAEAPRHYTLSVKSRQIVIKIAFFPAGSAYTHRNQPHLTRNSGQMLAADLKNVAEFFSFLYYLNNMDLPVIFI
jgi:hypothetical protein